jgi:hypothetical protein
MPSDREERARRRRDWPGGLVDATTPAQAHTAEERLAMMWQLAVDAWTLAGRELPTYTREDIPGKLIRPP